MSTHKAQVYYNLHKKTWSIKSMDSGENYGRVVKHAPLIVLRDATGHVSDKGRTRVLLERKKNVHASLRGIIEHVADDALEIYGIKNAREITYNPYKHKSFVYVDNGEPFVHSERVFMINKKVYAK